MSEDKKSYIANKNKLLQLRLMYLDNLMDPLVRKDKEIIYYKYIEGLTHVEIIKKDSLL